MMFACPVLSVFFRVGGSAAENGGEAAGGRFRSERRGRTKKWGRRGADWRNGRGRREDAFAAQFSGLSTGWGGVFGLWGEFWRMKERFAIATPKVDQSGQSRPKWTNPRK